MSNSILNQTLFTGSIGANGPVPNLKPRIVNQAYRLAFVGEAPGKDEVFRGEPFVGASGWLLWQVAAKHGIMKEACYVGNVCQYQPPKNQIKEFAWSGPEIQQGLAILWKELHDFQPHCVVVLGNTPLRAFTGHEAITLWRGSILDVIAGPYQQRFKVIPSIHPAAVLREYWQKTVLDSDLRLARREAMRPDVILPVRDIQVHLPPDEIVARLHAIREQHREVAIDIEGYWDRITCLGIATSKNECFVIPFEGWSLDTEMRIWRETAAMLMDPTVPKILQNGLYDTFCLQYGYKIPVRGVVDDTMLMHWELYCELPKKLSFLSSIYTDPREPYWKDERENEDLATRLTYCGKDCCVTYECRDVMRKQLRAQPRSDQHYHFNLDLNEPLLYMEQKGIRYDTQKALSKYQWAQGQINRLQWALNSLAEIRCPDDVDGWLNVCRDTLSLKNKAGYVTTPNHLPAFSKLSTMAASIRATEILQAAAGGGGLSIAAVGELSILTATALNVKSEDQIGDFLYRRYGLPIQYKKEHGRKTEAETTDVLALLTLYKKTQDPILRVILGIRSLRTRCQSLAASADPDGRIRCGYNSVGTETGRLSCYKSPTGSGFNLQTVTKKDRDLFLPDPGYWLFQCDLSGADGWTVAAHCLSAGDPTMMQDYLYGLKPAKILSLIAIYGRQVLTWDRAKLKHHSKEISSDDWMYFARKRVQHGSNYGMGGQTMSDTILKDSFKLSGEPIYVSPAQCEQEQSYYMQRYPGVAKWHQKLKAQLKQYGKLTSSGGHTRIFFGRREDFQTFKDACADEPQNNTTFTTNKALLNLWTDPSNRVCRDVTVRSQSGVAPFAKRSVVELRVQPVHQVHDALIGQFSKDATTWAVGKIAEWFRNTLYIAGQRVVIPFEGAYGESWGNLHEGVIRP